MLGLRGVRLSIVFPGIARMQTAAIVGAAAPIKKEGIEVNPDRIPLSGHAGELKAVRGDLERLAKETAFAEGVAVDTNAAMIEILRACSTAGEIAPEAECFPSQQSALLTHGASGGSPSMSRR